MAFGLGVLRLPSRDFWLMTPRELFRAVEGVYGVAPGAPSRAALEEMMRQFPDSQGST
ncbi:MULTISPECIES: rcc01693 family protein [Methylocystis]|uniref:Phage tail assembly chaperone n=2 Tax=Methylocystis TaxID=133 RepID=A0ABX6EG20_9HYPH|nr:MULTISPECIES: rcc01693 family protein [Methylocystis]QGM93559.1 phage tail assembly chaperone [Methylocystis rosea]ULO25025.1 phage tail assembly chaperone [Methylocystis sp. SB2]